MASLRGPRELSLLSMPNVLGMQATAAYPIFGTMVSIKSVVYKNNGFMFGFLWCIALLCHRKTDLWIRRKIVLTWGAFLGIIGG